MKLVGIVRLGGLLTGVLLVAARIAAAQNDLGVPNFSTLESHQYDSINLQNLNVTLNIPIRQSLFP